MRGTSIKIAIPDPELAPIGVSHGLKRADRVRKRVLVRGIVQGVGFRPWVYNLAKGLGLGGFVQNSSAGVTLAVEGSAASTARFLEQFVAGVGSLTPQAAQTGGVAFWAHVGGFLTGVLGVWIFKQKERQTVEWWGA